MKKHNLATICSFTLFIIGVVEFFMLSIHIRVPNHLIAITSILLFYIMMFASYINKNLKILVYPSIAIFFLIGLPAIGNLISNITVYIAISIISFIVTMLFLYKDLLSSNNSKERSK